MNTHPVVPAAAGGRAHLAVAVAALALTAACGCVRTVPTVYRGPLHHAEPETLKTEPGCEIALLPAADGVPVLGFRRRDLVTEREIQYYEKWLLHMDPAERDPARQRRELVPGEFIRVESPSRTVPRDRGPLAGGEARIDGRRVRLDSQGRHRDTDEMILRLLDTARLADNTEIELRITPPDCAPQDVRFTRRQVMEALGLALENPAGTSEEGLTGALRVEPAPAPGQTVTLTVTLTNGGPRPAAWVTARTFSRHPWLNGRCFYFGLVRPGESRSFSRRILLPAELPAGEALHGTVGIWTVDSSATLGATKRLQLPLELTLAQP